MLGSRLTLAAIIAVMCFLHAATAGASTETPVVASDVVDADGNVVTGTSIDADNSLFLHAQVSGAGAQPTGTVTFSAYNSGDCSGAAGGYPPAALQTTALEEAHTADISNAAGWDSATAWVSNGSPQFDTNWFGGLFAGNDNAFFAASSMGWRFTGVPLRPGDTIDAAYLSLRILKSRPSLTSEGAWTWSTVLATDTLDGSDFSGETRETFLGRFNFRGTPWQVPLSPDVFDPFGTNDGATYAASPDISDLVEARVAAPGWTAGGDIVVGIIDDATVGTAEAEVVDDPDYARLHLGWTSTEDVGAASSAAFRTTVGTHSYRAHYSGDSNYATADGPCMPLTVTPSTAPPSVGGIAQQPEISPDQHDGGVRRLAFAAWFIVAVAAGASAVVVRRLRTARRRRSRDGARAGR